MHSGVLIHEIFCVDTLNDYTKPQKVIQSPKIYKAQKHVQRHNLLDKTQKYETQTSNYLTRVATHISPTLFNV